MLGFKAYHAFESLGGAFNSHFGQPVPRGHSKKINVFVTNASHRPQISGYNVAVIAMLLSSMRNKYLYPELTGGTFKTPKDQTSLTDTKRMVARVKGVLRQVEAII